ncbi:MAG: hypothetical protein HRU17_20470 [Polyangiaceae bacterium]|nr:hypothetical protein [Polyangiaceae bacterium]
MTARLRVCPQKAPLHGSVPIASDVSIANRALIFAALGDGTSTLSGYSGAGHNELMRQGLAQLGALSERDGTTLRIEGVGIRGLRPSGAEIDCGDSREVFELLSGLVAPQPFKTRLKASGRLLDRPCNALVASLRTFGTPATGTMGTFSTGELFPPVQFNGATGNALAPGGDYQLDVCQPGIKSALLFAGLFASGPTQVVESVVTRDHTERLLDTVGFRLSRAASLLCLEPPEPNADIAPFEMELPGDITLASWLLASAAVVPDSHVVIRRTGINPSRAGVLDVFKAMGAGLNVRAEGHRGGEPVGELTMLGAGLRALNLEGELSCRTVNEFPILALLSVRAQGRSELSLEQLETTDNPEIAGRTAELLLRFGVRAGLSDGVLQIDGDPNAQLRAATVDAADDPQLILLALSLALLADGESVISGIDGIANVFPRMVGTFKALGANLSVESEDATNGS